MHQDLISVVVPVYNVESYLDKCVQSICSQSHRNLEIILSDDGSTDGSGAICDVWAQRDSRIRVIHKENGGLSDARNAGIEIASGDWYSFIDSDDFIATDTLERLHTVAVEYDSQIAVCNIYRVFENGEAEKFYCPAAEPSVYRGNERFETLKQPSVCNKLFRAELFDNLRFPKNKYYEDTFIYHILAHRAESIALTGHDGYFYLSRRASILGESACSDRFFDRIEAVYNRATYLLEHKISNYAEEACESLYVDVRCGYQWIPRTAENCEQFSQMWQWYQLAYDHLMQHPGTSWRMKLRLVLLRYVPWLHCRIY